MLAVGFFIVFFLVKELSQNEEDAPPEEVTGGAGNRGALILPVGLILISMFMLRFCRALPYPFIPLYVQELLGGIEGASAATGLLTSLVGLAAAVAAFTIVRLGDRMDKLLLVSICLGATFLASFPIFFTKTLYSFAALYVVMVFFNGAIEPSLQSYLSEHTSPSKRGKLFGIQTLVSSLGWFAAPLTGSAVSIRLGIHHVFLITSFCYGIAFIYSVASRRTISSRFAVRGRRQRAEG
jgi:DHA1 family multidrug resistance protein-like MFS transporter